MNFLSLSSLLIRFSVDFHRGNTVEESLVMVDNVSNGGVSTDESSSLNDERGNSKVKSNKLNKRISPMQIISCHDFSFHLFNYFQAILSSERQRNQHEFSRLENNIRFLM